MHGSQYVWPHVNVIGEIRKERHIGHYKLFYSTESKEVSID